MSHSPATDFEEKVVMVKSNRNEPFKEDRHGPPEGGRKRGES